MLKCVVYRQARQGRARTNLLVDHIGPPESLAECIRKIAEDVDGCAGMRWRAKDLFDADYHSGRICSRFANYLELVAPAAMGPGLAVPA